MDRYGGRGDMSVVFLSQLEAAIARGEPTQLDEMLSQIPAYLKSESVRQAAEKLRKVLTAERTAKEQAIAARIDTAISDAIKAVHTAKKAADLDETLANLASMQDNGEARYSEKNRGRMDKLRNLRQFVIQWQDYLFNRDTGNLQLAIQNLQNANNGNSAEILPRSEILAMIDDLSKSKKSAQESPTEKIGVIMEKTKSLDAIPAAIDSLTELQLQSGQPNYNYNDPIAAMKNELNAILQAYREYQAGMPALLSFRSNQSVPQVVEAFNAVLALRVELLRLTVARILGIDESLKPAADETIQKYLDRVMADAQSRADARLIGRVKELQDALVGKQSSGTSIGFLQPLLAAQNQEAAGQFIPAVISYQIALKIGGDLVPAKAIGSHLDGIKAAHPADFEKGMQLVLGNQTPAQPQNNTYWNPQPANSVTIPGSVLGKTAVSPSPASAP